MSARRYETPAFHNSTSSSPPRVSPPAHNIHATSTSTGNRSKSLKYNDDGDGEQPASPPTPPPPSPQCATVSEWNTQSARCERKVLPTPAALRAFLEARCGGAGGDAARGENATTTAAAVRGVAKARRKALLTLRGLDAAFVDALLRSATELDLDPAFFTAHAARRRYRPSLRRRGDCRFAYWTYPELVCGLGEAVWMGRVPVDDTGCALVRAVSDREDLAAVECRASLWIGSRMDVLVLDQMVWDAPGGLLNVFKKGRRMKRDGTERKNSWKAKNEELPSLENVLQDALSAVEEADLMGILEEIVYDKWLDFFDGLTPRQRPLIIDGTSLEWRALQALENNAAMSSTLSQSTNLETPYPNWPALLQRLRDRTALLPTVQLPPPHKPKRSRSHNSSSSSNPAANEAATSPLLQQPPSPTDTQDNQRALDRVTYLGALLLPTSLVASVLSMNNNFEPGQPLFWVFWAAAAPLTLLTVVVIYADKLRRAEVWVEEEEEGEGTGEIMDVGPGEKMDEGDGGKYAGGGIGAGGEPAENAHSPPQQQATPYAGVEDDVIVDLSGAVVDERLSVPDQLRRTGRPPRSRLYSHHLQQQASDEQPPTAVTASPPEVYAVVSSSHAAAHAWRKKELGWGGAAMCILRMRKPLRVEDGMPPVARVGRGGRGGLG